MWPGVHPQGWHLPPPSPPHLHPDLSRAAQFTRQGVQALKPAHQLQAGQPQSPRPSPGLWRSQLFLELISFPATRSWKGPSLPCQLHGNPQCQVCTCPTYATRDNEGNCSPTPGGFRLMCATLTHYSQACCEPACRRSSCVCSSWQGAAASAQPYPVHLLSTLTLRQPT